MDDNGSNPRRGRFGETKRAAFLQLLRAGGRRGASARAVGVDPDTISIFYRRYPDFLVDLEKAEMEANDVVEDALFKAAKNGNVVACQVWLYNRVPDRWADKRQVNSTITLRDEAELVAKRYGLDTEAVLRRAEELLRS